MSNNMITKVVYEDRNSQKPFKYVLPANPSEKYKSVEGIEADYLRETERCPFPKIRELIILFKTNHSTDSDVQSSDLLIEKYQRKENLQKEDIKMNMVITEAQISQLKVSRLLSCFEKYQLLFNTSYQIDGFNVVNWMNNLNSQYREEIRNFTNKQRNNKQQLMIESQVRKSESNYLSGMLALHEKYSASSTEIFKIENDYFTYIKFTNEFRKALVLISVIQVRSQLATDRSGALPVGLLTLYVDQKEKILHELSALKDRLSDFIEEAYGQLFDSRNSVKLEQSEQMGLEPLRNEWLQISRQLDELYQKLPNFEPILRKDNEEHTDKYLAMKRSYSEFLRSQGELREVAGLCSKKNNKHETVIANEKKKLTEHFKSNHGMVIPYTFSEEYQKMIKPYRNNNKIFDMVFGDKISPLEAAVEYTQTQYEILHKKACDANNAREVSRFKSEIQTKMKIFRSYENESDNSFAVHLIGSCRILLKIVS